MSGEGRNGCGRHAVRPRRRGEARVGHRAGHGDARRALLVRLGGGYRVGGEVGVDAGRHPQGVDGEVGEVGQGRYREAAAQPQGAEDLARSGVGRDDRAGVGGDGGEGAAFGAAQQGPYGGVGASFVLGGGVDALVARGGPGQQTEVGAGEQLADAGGQQVEEVVAVDEEARRREVAGEFGGGAVVPGPHARGDDGDAGGTVGVGHSGSASRVVRA